MENITYDYIWDQIISKSIKSIESSLTKQEKDKYNFKKRNLRILKNNIRRDYEGIKENLKASYHKNDEDLSNEDQKESKIDNHKIGACICKSLIENKVFCFDIKEKMPVKIYVSNYELAYMVSLAFVYTTLISKYLIAGQDILAEDLLKQKKLLVPTTTVGHDKYNDGRIHTMALNDIYKKEFDILTYSDMLFWIEHYNRQNLEKTLNPMFFSEEK